MSLYTEFDHYNSPIGPDGTPYQYFEALRDEAIETNTPIGWSEVYGGFWVPVAYAAVHEIMHNPQAISNREVTFPSYGNVEEGAERDYQLMLAGQVTVVVEVAWLMAKVFESELPLWLASPAKV